MGVIVGASLAVLLTSLTLAPTTTSPLATTPEVTPALAPPMAVGTTRNDIVMAAMTSSNPLAVAVLRFQLPPADAPDALTDHDVTGVVSAMAAAALRAVGNDGAVEVAQRTRSVTLVCSVPAERADTAVRAVDAALRALKTRPRAPKTGELISLPTLPAAAMPLDRGVERDDDTDVGLWLGEAAARPAGLDHSGAEAFAQMASWLVAEHLALVVVGPGQADDILKRSSGLVSAPLSTTTTATTTTTTATTATTTTATTTTTTTVAVARSMVVMRAPRPEASVGRVALLVLADLVGARAPAVWSPTSTAPWGLVSEGDGDGRMETDVVIGVGQAPPPPELVQQAARRQQLRALSRLDRVTRLADVVAAGILVGDAAAAFVDLAALEAVTPADVSVAARACATGDVRVVRGTGPPAPPTRPTMVAVGDGRAQRRAVVDRLDLLPVAVAVLVDDGPGAIAGPCGRRRVVAMSAGTPPGTGPTLTTTLAPPAAPFAGGFWLPLVMQAGLFDDEGDVLGLAVDLALAKAVVATTAPTRLGFVDGRAGLHLATGANVSAGAVAAALTRLSLDGTTMARLEATAAVARIRRDQVLGMRALRRIDRMLCTPHAPQAAPPSAAVLRTALAAPLQPTPDGIGAPAWVR